MSKQQQNEPDARVAETSDRFLFGHVDDVNGRIVSGWAVDTRLAGRPTPLLLVIDGTPVGSFECSAPRPDLHAVGLPTTDAGFKLELPETLVDGITHRIGIRFRSGAPLPRLDQMGEEQGDWEVRFPVGIAQGVVDGMFGNGIRGWAFSTHALTGKRTGELTIQVRSQGLKIGQVKADLIRMDVAEAMGCEPQCGFLFNVPARFRDGNPFQFEFSVEPDGTPLEGSPVHGRCSTRDSIHQLFTMRNTVEALCTELYALKDQLREMTSEDEYSLQTYGRWAAMYFATLSARMSNERRTERYAQLLGQDRPLISVICPTYKPNLADFSAAVSSVQNQTWDKWELIIVDDGSKSPALTALIDGLCAEDSRIKIIRTANGGISAATNRAVDAAQGEFVALFDHDDLLVDVALEMMVLAARHTGAPVLYSDEDKVTGAGGLSEPHLKSDWNYRLALTNNYVCHLLFVRTDVLRGLGGFRREYDGAQDHDVVLRLFEAVGYGGIHHVPEILYHWRRTPNSTASSQDAKSYAVEAGRQAVRDHLTRRGLDADVTAPFNTTVFDVKWKFDDEPGVTVLVPFKDQLETTRKCVDCLLSSTDYGNFRVILIDNWSLEPATLDWLAEFKGNKKVSVLRIEESFNYSRINNLAVQTVETPFILLLNNDVFVEQRNWLRLMVNEALADKSVGIVGGRLLYPNGMVQHAGVVLGVGGVGDHAFKYTAQDNVGYALRSVLTQEYSAVTAACLLIRTEAYRQVGMMDEEKLAVAFNDVDLCLKVRAAGYRVVYTSAVTIQHCESLSRGSDLTSDNLSRFYGENQVMQDRWGHVIRRDPFYNQHFSRETGMFEKLSSASCDLYRAPALLRDGAQAVVAPIRLVSHHPEPKPNARPVKAGGGSGRSKRRPRASRPA